MSFQPPFWTIYLKLCPNVRRDSALADCRVAKCPYMSLFAIWHLGRKRKLPKPIFDFLNADSSRSKCSFKPKGQAVNLSDGDGMQDPCQLKNHHKVRTTFKILKECASFYLSGVIC